jgi:hypothetical protein
MSFGIPVRNGLGIGLRASTALSTRGGAGGGLDVATVFSTYLYTGNGATQTITNGINLSGSGGLVWMKARGTNGQGNNLYDTVRGATNMLYANATNANQVLANGLTSFNSNGFSLGSLSQTNFNADNFASWTFRKTPKFFDVVTWTGNGVAGRQIAHNLGVAPGAMLVKQTNSASNWAVYHRSSNFLILNNTASAYSTALTATRFGDGTNVIAPTDTVFTVGGDTDVNGASSTYVAYLFAHDAASTGIIQCGSYTGNGLTIGPVINLGWEPQWLMIKNASGVGNWQVMDSVRGMPVAGSDATLQANLTNAESLADYVSPTATGFQVVSISSEVNTILSTYIYIAIRKAP